ncbi:MAG: dUTP diphosphatase [Oscillospiraceae bacterium]
MQIKFTKLHCDAIAPKLGTSGAAAADLYAICPDNGITIAPNERKLIPTGIAIELPAKDIAAFLFARSGLSSKHGLALANGVGVIDSDYRGEICVSLINLGSESYTISNKERIAQMAIMPVINASYIEAASLSGTQRGTGGFGSTGNM